MLRLSLISSATASRSHDLRTLHCVAIRAARRRSVCVTCRPSPQTNTAMQREMTSPSIGAKQTGHMHAGSSQRMNWGLSDAAGSALSSFCIRAHRRSAPTLLCPLFSTNCPDCHNHVKEMIRIHELWQSKCTALAHSAGGIEHGASNAVTLGPTIRSFPVSCPIADFVVVCSHEEGSAREPSCT